MKLNGDALLAERLCALKDPRDDSDWDEVLRRAWDQPSAGGRRLPGRRLLLIAVAVAVLMLAIGVALATNLGGFSGWLSGEPGSPASATEQSAFQKVNARSWAAFPHGTRLRRLIVQHVGGATYRLFGFRSGDELCLRLVASEIAGGARRSCLPRAELEQAKAPVAVVMADAPFGKAHVKHPARADGFFNGYDDASASFGFVASGVSVVELEAGKTTVRAAIGGEAFLLVRQHVPFGSRVEHVWAIDAEGHRAAIPFARSLYGMPSFSRAKPRFGPSRVERKPPPGSIAWLSSREPRGISLAQAHIPRSWLRGGRSHRISFARVLQPDPGNPTRVVLSLVGPHNATCVTWIYGARTGGGGCFNFELSPLSLELTGSGNSESEALYGLADDAVSRVDLFLSDGERWPLPLRNNAFVALVPRFDLPAKIVAYDAKGLVIAITPLTGFLR